MTDATLPRTDMLALDRTRQAAQRTLMAWQRTTLAMIGFGFTIYKFLQVVQEQSTVPVLRPQAPRNLGIALISIGTLSLLVACIQHWTYVSGLRPDQPYKPWDLAFITSCLLTLLGLLILVSIVVRSGPFS